MPEMEQTSHHASADVCEFYSANSPPSSINGGGARRDDGRAAGLLGFRRGRRDRLGNLGTVLGTAVGTRRKTQVFLCFYKKNVSRTEISVPLYKPEFPVFDQCEANVKPM